MATRASMDETHFARRKPRCRLCGRSLHTIFADLGATPLANSYVRPEDRSQSERLYPLRVFICDDCHLAQVEAVVPPEAIFSRYDYFSSYSDSLLTQSKAFALESVRSLGLSPGDRVIEVASNDGYLLQYFMERGMDVLGIEPAANVAAVATSRGVPTHVTFFGAATARALAAQGRRAKLIVANNVIAHVPDLHDFISGFDPLLEPGGTVSIECHHLLSLLQFRQFDTIYHEHMQYFSLRTLRRALAAHGLRVFDVERLPTQGGSLRVRVCREHDLVREERPAVAETLAAEDAAGLSARDTYARFGQEMEVVRTGLIAFLDAARWAGTSVACYGAAAKGNTLLNYCGIDTSRISFAVDRSPHKQGLLLPGSRIPIYDPDTVKVRRPDYLLILPWNIQDEIMAQMSYIRDWGGRFVVPIPALRVIP